MGSRSPFRKLSSSRAWPSARNGDREPIVLIDVHHDREIGAAITHVNDTVVADGSSDLPVMIHINQYDGLTIAVSEAKFITRVAKRTVVSDNAMSVLVPVCEKVLHWDSAKIRRFFGSFGLTMLEWEKVRTDVVTIQDSSEQVPAAAASQLKG